ncbi:hypothetical protein HDU96_001038 [Phlyctochytrium bullatum]|nr:hypothetical protein HDU96_001038 [Phlyctochytrium bullatum]
MRQRQKKRHGSSAYLPSTFVHAETSPDFQSTGSTRGLLPKTKMAAKSKADSPRTPDDDHSPKGPPRNPLTDPRVLSPLALHAALHIVTGRLLFPGAKLTKRQHMFVEKVPSTVNALVVSLPVIKMILVDRPWKNGKWLEPYPELLDKVFAAHFAYTAYDLLVMAVVEGEHPSVWLHHVVASFFPAAFCPSEITVVPTNLLYLLQNLDKVGLGHVIAKDAIPGLQTPLMVLRCIGFTLFRLFTGPACIFYAVQGEKGTTWREKAARFWERFSKLPLLVSSLTLFNILALSGLNAWWTTLVYKALFRHLRALSRRLRGLDFGRGLVLLTAASMGVFVFKHVVPAICRKEEAGNFLCLDSQTVIVMHRIHQLARQLSSNPTSSNPSPPLPRRDGLPANYPVHRTELNPVSFLKRTALLYPTRPAVIYEGQTINYAAFSLRVRRFAANLLRSGLQHGERVAVLVPNSPVILEAHFAVPLAQGVLVCINSRLNADEVEYILKKSRTKILFVDHELVGLAENAAACGVKEVVVCKDRWGDAANDPYEAFLARETGEPPKIDDFPPLKSEDECISINFTSGTTGRPKGVMYHYRGAYLLSLGDAMEMNLTCDSRYLWIVPMFHANGWCFPWANVAVGACNVILRKVDYDQIWHTLLEVGVTHYCAAPTVQTQIVTHPRARRLPNTVKTMVAAAPPSPTLLESMLKLNLWPVHVYGLTETYGPTSVCAWQEEWKGLSTQEQAAKVARQGQGYIMSDEIRVVNPDMTDTPWDGNTMGEVVMRGNIVMTGYLDDEKATTEAFRGGWFHSGDIGVRHPDGYVELRDRKKDIIISGGENCVVASPDEKWGERPVAYVTLKPGVRADEAWHGRFQSHLRGRLAGFKMPSRIEVVEDLPKTSTGKVQKFVLREREWKRAGKTAGGKRIN